MSGLRTRWLHDLRCGFAANFLRLFNDQDPRADFVPFFAAKEQLDTLSPSDCARLTLSTLSLLSAVEIHPDLDERGHVRLLAQAAKTDLKRLSSIAPPTSLLLAHALEMCRTPGVALDAVLTWARRVECKGSHPWDPRFWSAASKALDDDSKLRASAAESLERVRNATLPVATRADAIAEICDHLTSACGPSAAWERLCRQLVSGLYAWPLMVSDDPLGNSHGLSLPVAVRLIEDDSNRVSWQQNEYSSTVRDWRRQDVAFRTGAAGYTVHRTPLVWDGDWSAAFDKGLRAAKAIWKGQNGRAHEIVKARRSLACMDVDISDAVDIVQSVFVPGAAAPYKLVGRSAEGYWAQVALSLMLQSSDLPSAVVTGTLDEADGEWRLGWVAGLLPKLAYASASGHFTRIVVSDSSKTRDDVSEARANDKSEAFRLIEINHCPNSRSAADAVQSSGWRRARFLRAPEVQGSFYGMLGRLFEDRAPRADGAMDPRQPLDPAELRTLTRLATRLSDEISSIRRLNTNDVYDDRLGECLGWLDHVLRNPDDDVWAQAGLGIVVIRTSEEENEIRFWRSVFAMLGRLDLFEKFRWAPYKTACALLAEAMTVRSFDHAGADLLVVIDDAGRTDKPTNAVFPEDVRGQLYYLLRQGNPLDKGLLDQGDTRLAGKLGRTRVVVLPKRSEEGYLPEPRHRSESAEHLAAIKALCIFRQGFTLHQAALTIGDALFAAEEDKHSRWTKSRALVDALISRRLLFRHHGILTVHWSLRAEFSLELHSDAEQHWRAAGSFAPFVDPASIRLAVNVDRMLEPEAFGEARWHLEQSLKLLKRAGPSGRKRRREVGSARTALKVLELEADWDTVRFLRDRRDKAFRRDAAQLAEELIKRETAAGERPHSSRYGLAISALGGSASSNKELQKEQLDSAARLYAEGLDLAKAATSSTSQQVVKIASDWAACLRQNEGSHGIAETLLELETRLESDIVTLLNRSEKAPVNSEWLTGRCLDTHGLDTARRAQFSRYGWRVWGASNDIYWVNYFALESDAAQMADALLQWDKAYDGTESRPTVGDFKNWLRSKDLFDDAAIEHRGRLDAARKNLQEAIKSGGLAPWPKARALATLFSAVCASAIASTVAVWRFTDLDSAQRSKRLDVILAMARGVNRTGFRGGLLA